MGLFVGSGYVLVSANAFLFKRGFACLPHPGQVFAMGGHVIGSMACTIGILILDLRNICAEAPLLGWGLLLWRSGRFVYVIMCSSVVTQTRRDPPGSPARYVVFNVHLRNLRRAM